VLERARAGVLAVMEEEIIALVQAVTDRILLAPGAVDPDLIRRVVRESIGRVSQAERLAVRLNPDDLERVREFRPRLLENMGRLKYLDLLPTQDLRPGDCLVEGPQTQVDATLATRRERIFQLLEETFHQSAALDLSTALEESLEAAPDASQDLGPDTGLDAALRAGLSQAKAAAPAPEPAPAPAAPAPVAELEDW
jgi:flagellar assembly protein FliH